jgi:exosortase/archaeosortase family protein
VYLRTALCAIALTVLVTAVSSMSGVRRFGFCAPAAHLAALATGLTCTAEPSGYMLKGTDLDLEVVPACAAIEFCCLLTGFLSVLMFWRGWPLASQLAVIPLAWLVTVTANAVRLASCWQADRWACASLPPPLWPGIHLVTGIATFLLALTAVFYSLTCRKAETFETPRRALLQKNSKLEAID